MDIHTEEPDYKFALKTIFHAHDADVRVIKPAAIPENGIITGSRDSLVKVWMPEENSFRESRIFSGATKYIASLCVLPSSVQYPNGLILAGSNDCSIYGFSPDSSEPVLRLLGHSGAVCSLSSGKFGFIISGSWDKTAKVWSGQQCTLTLQGHQEAVWATEVFPTQNLILTGSADRTIRLWQSGSCEKVFRGHEDCVRGLAVVSEVKFLSCSNDCTVRSWLISSGECVEVYKSHTDYIYNITLLKNGYDFSTCGEDQNIKIWKNGLCVQTIVLASKTLWCIACLPNGNLAVGTCDGKVYVLEQVPVDYFEKLAASKNTLTTISDARDAEGDKNNTSSGETVIFYELENDFMYVCNYESTHKLSVKKEMLNFQVINDTQCKVPVPSSSGTEILQKKTDYEFDVDVENTRYKLAFNKWENPWDVATKFVGTYNLHPEHVSQIVDYILKNTTPLKTEVNEYVPGKGFLSYLNINITGLRSKLLEFCLIVPSEQSITESEVDELLLLAHYPDVVSPEQMASLDKVISWNDEFLFPVLDLLRIAVKCKDMQTRIGTKAFINHLLLIFRNTKKIVNRILIEKIFCNMFGMDGSDEVLFHYQEKIFELLREIFSLGEKGVQNAGAALLHNFAVASYKGFSLSLNSYCINTVKILGYITESEAAFRVLVAIGTVCINNSSAVSYFKSLNTKQLLLKFEDNSSPKIKNVVSLLLKEL